MSVLGIIAEYNPFHNGHKYHLEQSKKLCDADSVVCVMSGNFIQRGEPAIVDKWARAEMALISGADLVIELPVVYSMSSAEYFAFGAVKILDSLGIIDCICFGSECGSIDKLYIIADILNTQPESFKISLKEHLAKGLSFPAARENALAENIESGGYGSDCFSSIIKSSNNILGIEYIKALIKLGSKIKPYTIKRVANEYNSEVIEGAISSATSIRKHISSIEGIKKSINKENSKESNIPWFTDSLLHTLPESSLEILSREFIEGRGPVFSGDFENIVLSALRSMSIKEISELPYITEGLENRFKAAAENSGSLVELIESISTKRYTITRIKRCLFSILTGIKSKELLEFNLFGGPQYLRVLGFNNNGRRLLSKIKISASLPVIVKAADFKASSNPLLARMLQIEATSTDQYVLAFSNSIYKKSGQEFTRNPIRLLRR